MQEMQEARIQSLGREDPWSRRWQPTPVFLPENLHGQRSLQAVIYGVAELDRTEHTRTLLLSCKKLSSFHREDSIFLNNQRSMKKTQSTGNHLDKNPESFLADYLEGKGNPCTVS